MSGSKPKLFIGKNGMWISNQNDEETLKKKKMSLNILHLQRSMWRLCCDIIPVQTSRKVSLSRAAWGAYEAQKWEDGGKSFSFLLQWHFTVYNGFQGVTLESSRIEFHQSETITFALIWSGSCPTGGRTLSLTRLRKNCEESGKYAHNEKLT